MKLRRKSEGRTDYRKRLRLIRSNKPRFVVRKSLKNISVQITQFNPDGDKVLFSADTKELIKKYKFNAKRNIPSAYLVGLLIASKAKDKIKEAVLDTGLYKSVKGSIIYAVLKGAIDGGLNVPHKKEIFPKQERLLGKHTKYKEDELKNLELIKSKLLNKK